MHARATTAVAAILAAAGLGVNAWVHLRLATPFDANSGELLGQGDLFRIQAVVNVVAALLVLAVRKTLAAIVVVLVAFGGVALLILTTLTPVDLTPLGLPYLYEPGWYTDKWIALVSQALAALAAVGLILLRRAAPGSV